MLAPSFPESIHALLGLHRDCKHLGIELAVAPRDVRVVHDVLEPKVRKRYEPSGFDPDAQIGAVGKVVIEQAQHVAFVSTVRGGGQAE